jgi:hypothetical protein
VTEERQAAAAVAASESPASNGSTCDYWLRVHGYPGDLTRETVYYGDFVDLMSGPLPEDPRAHLKAGDVLIYYADGPGSLYGVATVTGEVEGPLPDVRRGHIWEVPIKRDALIKAVNKMPHAVALEPPSGRHFLWFVRDYTYIKLPVPDGVYLVHAVKSRAGGKD